MPHVPYTAIRPSCVQLDRRRSLRHAARSSQRAGPLALDTAASGQLGVQARRMCHGRSNVHRYYISVRLFF